MELETDFEVVCGSVVEEDSALELQLIQEAERTRRRRYWIGPGKFSDISREETVAKIQRSFLWLEQMTNTKFIQVDRERDALNKVYFASAARVGQIVGDGKSYYAVQWPANSWHFNQDLKVSHRRKYSVEAVNIHEFGHSIKFKHTSGPKDIMHANVRGWYPTAKEIIMIQKKLGKSPGFWPIPQQELGEDLRETTRVRDALVAERQLLQTERQRAATSEEKAVITEKIRNELTPQIQRLNDKINEISVDWHWTKEEYRIVPGAK